DQGEQAIDQAKAHVQEAGQEAHQRADAAMTTSGERLQDAAQTVRRNAPSGPVGDVAHRAADMMDQSATYLQRSNPTDVRDDMERSIRSSPMQSLLIGFGVGFLFGRITRGG
ncbi:MAG: hypothetical protein HC876_04805, partial [Chloroflexaceae bacterium]|nr:hypothetical protein [Chloroflexaceae bacterium]